MISNMPDNPSSFLLPFTLPRFGLHLGVAVAMFMVAFFLLHNFFETLVTIGPLFACWFLLTGTRNPWLALLLPAVFLLAGFFAWAGYNRSVSMLDGRFLVSEWFIASWYWLNVMVYFAALAPGILLLIDWIAPAGGGDWNSTWRISVTVIFIVVFCLGGFAFLTAANNIHRSKVGNKRTPGDNRWGLEFEPVTLRTTDGHKISAWWLPSPGAGRTIILCHGIGAYKSDIIDFAPPLMKAGWNVMMFDFRGHGDSSGHTTSFGYYERRDVAAAYEFICSQDGCDPGQVVGYGVSMGTSALIHAVANGIPLRGLVLDSPFARIEAVAQTLLPVDNKAIQVPVFALFNFWSRIDLGLSMADISPVNRLHKINVPIFFIHGTADRVIPCTESEVLYQTYQHQKELEIVPGAQHIGSSWRLKDYHKRILDFLANSIQYPNGD
ncbi:alpha/beta fold hydrolase [Planctomycetota bacterium]